MPTLTKPSTVSGPDCHRDGSSGRLTRRLFCLALPALVAACAPRAPFRPDLFADPYNAPYQLASGDRLRVIVFGQDNLSNIYSVDAQGLISMPLVGTVKASGLTLRDLEHQIEARLRNGYLREPRVSIEVDQYRPFFVLGEVLNSGQYPFVAGMTVQTAVAIAGGFTPRAYQSTAEITRFINGDVVTATVPITYPVRPGDTVVIRERWF